MPLSMLKTFYETRILSQCDLNQQRGVNKRRIAGKKESKQTKGKVEGRKMIKDFLQASLGLKEEETNGPTGETGD